jgi:prepilin-type N-terminal cleavage/methylation domain-containing protein
MTIKFSFQKERSGFTLIELLLTLAIISVLAITILVAIKPAQRLADARDARRAQDVNEILTGIHECVIDKKDSSNMNTCLGSHTVAVTYEITAADISTGCKTLCSNATSDSSCLNLGATLTDYFTEIPKDPSESVTGHTGYSLTQFTNGMVVIDACAAENSVIKVSR